MQPKPRGPERDSEASQVLADLRSLILDRGDAAEAEEPELLLVNAEVRPQSPQNQPLRAASESLARSRARMEQALSDVSPQPAPPAADRPRRTFSTGSERPRPKSDAQPQAAPIIAEPIAAIQVEVQPDLESSSDPVAAPVVHTVAADAGSPPPIAAARETVRVGLDSGDRPAPTAASNVRADLKREPRLTDSLAAGLRQANREVEELIVANRTAYMNLFGAADLPVRSQNYATPMGTSANGQLVGTLSELQSSVAELGVLLEMMLPRI